MTPTLTRSLIARVALTSAPPVALELMSRLSTPSDLRTFSNASALPERVATAFASWRAWNADRLPDDLLKQDSGKDLVLRQARIGADLKRRLNCGAGYGDAGDDAARARLGDEIEIGHDIAVEADVSAGESEARAQKQ